MKTAVVGAGWAGLAAATALREAGCDVTVYESGHTPGGRARRVPHLPHGGTHAGPHAGSNVASDGALNGALAGASNAAANGVSNADSQAVFGAPLDNGQHILLGAYTETLALMRRLGRDLDTLFYRQPLCLASLDGSFRLAAPRLPAPLHAAVALLSARGLGWNDRMACLRLMRSLRGARWQVAESETVGTLLRRHDQPPRAVRLLWEPLCLAALNTPVELACAQLYANVLRDSLGGPRAATDVLIPRTDLSALWPDAAAARCRMRYGHTVHTVTPSASSVDIDGERYDAAVIAVPPASAARLLAAGPAQGLAAGLDSMSHAPIATLNLKLAAPWPLPQPMMMLTEDPARGHDGQWVFDRTVLAGPREGAANDGAAIGDGAVMADSVATGGGTAGNRAAAGKGAELAIVISAATAIAGKDRIQAIDALIDQLREQALRAGLPPMPAVTGSALLVDKRATFLAIPGLARPAQRTPWPSLALAGDWTDTGYPGVLEGAVRSGLRAANAIIEHKAS
jgi:squalene-associated FAD-dependent desaturase